MTTAFDEIFRRYGADVAPFMHAMREEWAETRPLAGLRIAHNIPLTATTLLKLDCLRLAGADLLVTSYSYCQPDEYALRVLKQADIPYQPVKQVTGDFDILMDCGAELLAQCRARLGAVELTRTGAVAYERAEPSFPVISVDNTRLKQLETCLGTGEGVYRAICALAERDLAGARLLLFGFGKVGRGIAHYFEGKTKNICVVEMLPDRLQVALDRGYDAIPGSHKAEVEDMVRQADVVVTATGRAGVITDYYDPDAFRQGAVLANAGAEDEYGQEFDEEEILFAKGPVNFSQPEPTQMPFLDPVFYAHNLAALELLQKPAPDFYPLAHDTDNTIMRDWCAFHGRDEKELEDIFGP